MLHLEELWVHLMLDRADDLIDYKVFPYETIHSIFVTKILGKEVR